MEEKIIKDGKVAVAVSRGFGAGWTTWNSKISPFEPKVIELILAGEREKITEDWCERELGIKECYCGGVEGLDVQWVTKGLRFSINEYDGSESLYIENELDNEA